MEKILGHIVDIENESIFPGSLTIRDGLIVKVARVNSREVPDRYILPGFVDSHIHIESSMLLPSHFAAATVPHGTIAVICDPHEIANVCGKSGVYYMINNGLTVPLKFFNGAPSSVPATNFETSGACINSQDVLELLSNDQIWFLSEVMNYPGVINGDPEIDKKIASAKKLNKVIDGHAPGLSGKDLDYYISCGISTDHECSTYIEAKEKIMKGMKILIRDGSAAKNFKNLYPLISQFPDDVMLCTDDSHPDEILSNGHIDRIIRLGLSYGVDIFKLLKAAIINPIKHYKLPIGLLKEGDLADFIIVDSLKDLNVLSTFIDGSEAYNSEEGYKFSLSPQVAINNFCAKKVTHEDFLLKVPDYATYAQVINVKDGELITDIFNWDIREYRNNYLNGDLKQDIIKLVVYNRYSHSTPSIGFVKNIGLKDGAIGGTVAHDSHNIVVAGTDDQYIVELINNIVDNKGGIGIKCSEGLKILPLPVAGLMSLESVNEVALLYTEIDSLAKKSGSQLSAPFMTLSFLSLLVIPSLKLSDKGLFCSDNFQFESIFK
ncbi:adenine deaminase [Marinilabiliaceae bacterium ANBcel2]|nr:adenine deaminase [Marinilabiliaceae bacterium ANBcel2]